MTSVLRNLPSDNLSRSSVRGGMKPNTYEKHRNKNNNEQAGFIVVASSSCDLLKKKNGMLNLIYNGNY